MSYLEGDFFLWSWGRDLLTLSMYRAALSSMLDFIFETVLGGREAAALYSVFWYSTGTSVGEATPSLPSLRMVTGTWDMVSSCWMLFMFLWPSLTCLNLDKGTRKLKSLWQMPRGSAASFLLSISCTGNRGSDEKLTAHQCKRSIWSLRRDKVAWK